MLYVCIFQIKISMTILKEKSIWKDSNIHRSLIIFTFNSKSGKTRNKRLTITNRNCLKRHPIKHAKSSLMGHFSLAIASLWDTGGRCCLIMETPILSNSVAFFEFKPAMGFDVAFKKCGSSYSRIFPLWIVRGMVYYGIFYNLSRWCSMMSTNVFFYVGTFMI